ncbi:MAG: dual specificity protein phosphatase family protein [Planctomycetes bacterium]|nr:dual specificity protein phosphatase family protein [Planctomycetota bacterium]
MAGIYEILNGKLYGSQRPGRGPSAEKFARQAEKLNVLCVISLQSTPPAVELVKKLGNDNIKYVHVPVADFTPPSEEDMEIVRACYRESRKAGKALLLHCTAGFGRTGTAAAALLATEEGMDARKAMKLVREARPGAVETPAQEEFILEYAGKAATAAYRQKQKRRKKDGKA